MWRPIIRSKSFVGIVCFIAGALSTYGIDRYRIGHELTRRQSPDLDQMFDDDFFGHSRDPFEDMRRMRERMMKPFGDSSGFGGFGANPFDSWYRKKFGGNSGEVRRREDNENVYYEITLKGLKKSKVDVKVEDGQITISGETESGGGEGDAGAYISSSFHRSFPVPPDVDADRAQMEKTDGKIIVKFPKLKSA